MKFIMFVIMFNRASVDMHQVEFDSQLTCEATKTAIVEMYDNRRIGNIPVILCVRK